jgi:hypothetical protein
MVAVKSSLFITLFGFRVKFRLQMYEEITAEPRKNEKKCAYFVKIE